MYINNSPDFSNFNLSKTNNKNFSLKSNKIIKTNDNLNIDKTELKKALSEMDELIGLKEIKKLVKQYISFIEIQNLRKNYGLKKMPIVSHMIFKGNPGTGKTTVARIIAKIFKALGYLEKGHFMEIERVDLVGEYIGHTAKKTKNLIEKAYGGILFIDEAYSLARGGEKDFGKESIDTMVKAMEDYKENLIIILAGYKKEMENFLLTNPGLKSRISLHLDFKDYNLDELVAIAELMFNKREYQLMNTSKSYLYRLISLLNKNNNGNARMIRNLIEKTIRIQANRVIKSDIITKNDLITIKKEDLIESFKQEVDNLR